MFFLLLLLLTCQKIVTISFLSNDVVCLSFLWPGILVFVGCVFVYKARNIDCRFGEPKQVGFCLYNIAITGCVAILFIHFIDLDPVSQKTVQAFGVFWGTFVCSFLFVLPHLMKNKNGIEPMLLDESSNRNLSSSKDSINEPVLSSYVSSMLSTQSIVRLERITEEPSNFECNESLTDDPVSM